MSDIITFLSMVDSLACGCNPVVSMDKQRIAVRVGLFRKGYAFEFYIPERDFGQGPDVWKRELRRHMDRATREIYKHISEEHP